MTFPDELVRQNDMVHAKIQLLLSLLRSIDLTFSKINGITFLKKNKEVKNFRKKVTRKSQPPDLQPKHPSTLNDNTFFYGKSENVD